MSARGGGGFAAAAAGILVLAAALRFWGLANGLPHPLTRPDEEVMLNHVLLLARGDWDLRYAVYPSFYFYVTWAWTRVALGAAALVGLVPAEPLRDTLAGHPDRVLLAGRALSATAATLTVALTMALARRTLGRVTALLAGGLLATNLLHVRDAHAAKPDALLTFGVVAALGLMAEAARAPARWRWLAVGVVIGLATGIKYPALLLLAPAWVAAVQGSRRAGWRRWLANDVWLVGAVAGVTFVTTSPYLFLNPETRRAVLGVFGSIFPGLFPSLVPPALPAALLEMTPARAWWSGYSYHLAVSLRYGAGLLPTVLAVPALLWGCRAPAAIGRIATAWSVLYFAIHGLSPMLLARYMTPLLPALFVLEAGVLAALLGRLPAARRALAAVAVGMALLAVPLRQCVAYDRLLARDDTRLLATEWLEAHARRGARVLVAGTFFWGYGEPLMPRGVDKLRLEPGATELPAGVDFVLGHDHPTFASRFDPAALAPFAERLRLVLDLDPFVGPRDGAVFEEFDAYYVPLDGFGVVERTGPRIRIYAVGG